MPEINTPGILHRDEAAVSRLRQDKETDIKVSRVIQKVTELLQDPDIQSYLDSGKNLELWSASTGGDRRRRQDSKLYITPSRQIVFIVEGQMWLKEKAYELTDTGFIDKVSERTEREVINQKDDRPKLGTPMGTPFGGESGLRELVTKGEITPESIQKQVEYQTISTPLTESEQSLLNQRQQLDQLKTRFDLLVSANDFTGKYVYDESSIANYNQDKQLLETGLQLTPEEEKLVQLAVDTWHSYWREKGPETVERENYTNFAEFLGMIKQLVESYESANAAIESFIKREAARQDRKNFLAGYETPLVRYEDPDQPPLKKNTPMSKVRAAIKKLLSR